jgi:hypothetical protein
MSAGFVPRRFARDARGQTLLEFTLVMPLILLLSLGVVEVSWALLDQHIVTKMTREGSNLISRDTTLQDAVTAMRTMSSRPVDFDSGNSRVIFSVLKMGATVGTPNYGHIILYRRHAYGGLTGKASKLTTAGVGSFRGAPDFEAINSDNDTGLRITTLPPNLTMIVGGMLYVTEIYTQHTTLTPFEHFGPLLPETLYSIAYF